MKRLLTFVYLALLTAFSACADDDEGGSAIKLLALSNATAPGAPSAREITITTGGVTMEAVLEDNASAKALLELLAKGAVTVQMHDYGGFEKSGALGSSLARSDKDFTAIPGDIILYQGKTIVIYYGENTYNFTKLGHIKKATKEGMRGFLKAREGNITVTFSLSGSKGGTLVAYFSATGTTQNLAKRMATLCGGTSYKILPQTDYTSSDLNWHDKNSRTSIECNDKSFRAKMKGTMPDLSAYDTVLLGFPIWWGEAPSIIQTFLESGDFSSKKIALFCTSGASGINAAAATLKKSAPKAKWLSARRFSGVNDSEIADYLKEAGL